MPQVLAFLESERDHVQELADTMSRLLHPVAAAPLVGYVVHPTWAAIDARRSVVDAVAHSKVAKQIVYRLDTATQFMDLTKTEHDWDSKSGKRVPSQASQLRARM
eukprot:7408702-Lingulodinium_polyedra.AAC.1